MRLRPDTFSIRYNALFPLYAKLPPAWAYHLAGRQAKFFMRRKGGERAAVQTQMQRVFPQAELQQLSSWVDDYFQMVEQEALDAWHIHRQPITRLVELQGFEAVRKARGEGRRVLLTGGHYGRFWMAGPAMRAQGHTVGTITRDGGNENQHGLHPAEFSYRQFKLQRLQAALGGPFLVEGDDLRPLYTSLDNHLIALIFDVPYTQAHAGCVTVPFLGSTINVPAGIYRIAKRTKAVIAPFYMRDRGGGQVIAEFPGLLDPDNYKEKALMSLLASQLEERIRARPGQWSLWPALPLLQRE